jgi:hypothetical protein
MTVAPYDETFQVVLIIVKNTAVLAKSFNW